MLFLPQVVTRLDGWWNIACIGAQAISKLVRVYSCSIFLGIVFPRTFCSYFNGELKKVSKRKILVSTYEALF